MDTNWYQDANKMCSELAIKHNIQLWQVVGILVSFSAQKQWSKNIIQLKQFLAGEKIEGMYSTTQLKAAQRIKDGEDPLNVFAKESFKYRNFYKSILLEDGAICVDSHIIRAYLKEFPYSKLHKVEFKRIFETKWCYELIQKWVRKFSELHKIPTYDAQALIWIKQRGNGA